MRTGKVQVQNMFREGGRMIHYYKPWLDYWIQQAWTIFCSRHHQCSTSICSDLFSISISPYPSLLFFCLQRQSTCPSLDDCPGATTFTLPAPPERQTRIPEGCVLLIFLLHSPLAETVYTLQWRVKAQLPYTHTVKTRSYKISLRLPSEITLVESFPSWSSSEDCLIGFSQKHFSNKVFAHENMLGCLWKTYLGDIKWSFKHIVYFIKEIPT